MRRALAAAVAVLVAIVIGIVLLAGSMTRSGLSVHAAPSSMEAMMARRMRALAVPSDLKDAKNPVPLTPEVLAEARAHFADHCATCHGNDGKGDTAIGRKLYPPAPDMTLAATQELSDGALFAIIENGVRLTGMPGWGTGTAESAYGSWTLVHFIRHLPKLTPAEIREMERLNPMSRAAIERAMQEEAFLSGEEPASGAAAHAAPPHEH